MPITDFSDPASPAPGRLARWRRLRSRLSRYARARAADLFGDPGPFRAARDGFARTSAALDLVSDRPPGDRRAEEGSRAWPVAPIARRRHEAEAAVARVLFSAAVVSVLVCAHRLWLADALGAGASLGMAFTLAGFALKPAYRCWRIRARAPADPRAFLCQPSAWWPHPLPPDDPA
ncbi:MAG: hypothetical protein U1F59_00650 [Candidatus Competibacteraceae bacterium]